MNLSSSTKRKYEILVKTHKNRNINDPIKLYKDLLNEGYKIGSALNILSAILWNIKNTENNKELEGLYSKVISTQKKTEVKKEYNNIKTFEEYKNILEEYKNKKIKKSRVRYKYYVIGSLYIYQKPRRIKDYSEMNYIKERKEILDNEKNYYISTEGKFIFNKFKTEKTLGQQEYKVMQELKLILDEYIKREEIESGSSIFNVGSDRFNNSLKKVFGKDVTVNTLRHAFINKIYGILNLTKEDMEEIAKEMGQSSIGAHLSYITKKTNKMQV